MTPEQIERVFGRGRLKMVTGEHVEVFREAVARGERRRYTKRFLNTREGDFGQWTEREWRILARLIGHGIACVPDVVQFDRGRLGGMRIVQTYDAGVTVDQWATLLPVTRDGRVYRHVFEDCAHWWALAHHCLRALNEIHPLELVHLDIKGDNICIPYAPPAFDPDSADLQLRPVFTQLALIDFAFALISRESLTTALPIGWQKDYDYQSPRLLAALEAGRNGDLQLTRELDWRCDMYSLAAMLKRYLPDEKLEQRSECRAGWTIERHDAAKALILRLRECHDAELPLSRPHPELMELTGARLQENDLLSSLEQGWILAREASVSLASGSLTTPITHLVPVTPLATPAHLARTGQPTAVTVIADAQDQARSRNPGPSIPLVRAMAPKLVASRTPFVASTFIALLALAAAATALWQLGDHTRPLGEELQALSEPIRSAADRGADAVAGLVHRKEKAPSPSSEAPSTALAAAKNAAPPRPAPEPRAMPQSAQTALADPTQSSSAAPARSTEKAPSNVGAQPAPASPSSPSASVSPTTPMPTASAAAAPALQQQGAHASVSSTTKSAAKAAKASSRPMSPSRTSPAPSTATASRAAQTAVSPQPSRTHAAWAALEPPAWSRSHYRGDGPGEPPGKKTAETRSAASGSVPDAPQPKLASSAPSAARSDAARPAATAPSPAPASPDQPRQGSAAPIEDRSDTLSLAFAAPASVSSVRRDRAGSAVQSDDDFNLQARRSLLETVPRVAKQAEPEVARVLLMAASAYRPTQERAVADAARAMRIRDDTLLAGTTSPVEARRLNNQARAAFSSGRDVLEAFDLQLRAFNANPRDPEIAGSLALLYLKLAPPQPDMARQVALIAIAARGPQYTVTRMEDWNTFAVASALSGRDADARNALFVTMAIAGNVERSCVAALNAVASYGEQLRAPVEAMLYRVHAQGRSYDSPWCSWPPNWSTPPRIAFPAPGAMSVNSAR
jgi:hypothetical protein